jgi:hypothetical protein
MLAAFTVSVRSIHLSNTPPPGIMARSGKWPGKKLSLMVTHLYPTAYFSFSHSTTRSTSRKGYLRSWRLEFQGLG